jgi:rRNA-processing protein FCF1
MLGFRRENPVIHVVLDTSIYTSDKTRSDGPFRALTRLTEGEKVQLHVPYVVKQEFVSQRAKEVKKQLKAIREAAKAILDESTFEGIVGYAEECIESGQTIKANLPQFAEMEFSQWLHNGGATVHPIAAGHGDRAMKDYFVGAKPFKEAKNRLDIPDSFIWQTILDLRMEHNPLHVVANDKALYAAASNEPGIVAYNDLKTFIDSDGCRAALLQLEDEIVATNVEKIGSLLRYEKSALETIVNAHIVDALAWKTIRDGAIPDDNHEAHISMVGSADNLVFDFENVEYYGEAELGVPFTAQSECLLDYAIFQADYYTMSDEESAGMSVSELNDHYLEVEQYFTIDVEGVLSISLDRNQIEDEEIDDDDIDDLIPQATFKLEIKNMKISEKT